MIGEISEVDVEQLNKEQGVNGNAERCVGKKKILDINN